MSKPIFIYEIRVFYKDRLRESEHVKFVRTREEAQDHCSDPNTESEDWFDGYFQRELTTELMEGFKPFVI